MKHSTYTSTYLVAFSFFVLILTSCNTKKTEQKILTAEEMASVLTDIYILEGKLNALRIPKDSSEYLFKTIEPTIFAEHGIDSTDYKRSFESYLTDYKKLNRVFELVVDSLSNRELVQRERNSRTRKFDGEADNDDDY